MNTKKLLIYSIISALLLLQLCSLQVYAVNTQELNYTLPPQSTNANLVVTVLKYDPFPVNAGDWFDLWVKVQNSGQTDAKNAQFEIVPEYPFSSNDSLVRNFGLLYGTANAYKINPDTDASQAIMKFRIKVDESAPSGVSNIKFISKPNADDTSSTGTVVDLPIEIAKTKTDFEIKFRDINPQETSFVITNIGDNAAKSVTFDIKSQEGVTFLKGAEPSLLGDLNQGDFTIAHIKAVPQENTNLMIIEISYTDTSGVRTTLEKKISVPESMSQNLCTPSSDKSYLKWAYGLAGLITGAFIIILLALVRSKKRASK